MSREPNTLKVRLHQIRLNRDAKSLKVFLTGDWHISPIVSSQQTRFLTEALEQTKPDVIIIQGDLVDSPVELTRETTLKKLMRELKLCAKYAPTAVVLGNHDYITPIAPIEVRKESSLTKWNILCKKCGVNLLLDEWLDLPGIRIFGAFQEEDCIVTKSPRTGKLRYHESPEAYEKKAEAEDFINNICSDKVNWFAAHIPLLTPKLLEKLNGFDVLSFGHTHGGIVPRGVDELLEKINVHGGFYSAGKKPFPRKVRGMWEEKKGGFVVINSGMVGTQFCAPRPLQRLNFLKAA